MTDATNPSPRHATEAKRAGESHEAITNKETVNPRKRPLPQSPRPESNRHPNNERGGEPNKRPRTKKLYQLSYRDKNPHPHTGCDRGRQGNRTQRPACTASSSHRPLAASPESQTIQRKGHTARRRNAANQTPERKPTGLLNPKTIPTCDSILTNNVAATLQGRKAT